MAKNTSILLGDYFDQFINSQVQSGRFSSASEVVRAALRLFEQEENKQKELMNALKAGEKSGMKAGTDASAFLKKMHSKHTKNGL